jgi:hypothetical protein
VAVRGVLYLGAAAVAACVMGAGVALYDRAMPPPSAHPENGHFSNGVYVSNYFNLAYRLPEGWVAGLAGPDPSQSGYYVLGTWVPDSELAGTILVAAQDMFFAEKPEDGVKTVAADFRQVMSSVDGMIIDREPTEVTIGGHLGNRVDFSGVGLYRSMFAVEIRCHIVTFNLTTRDPHLLASLIGSLDHIDGAEDKPVPACIRDYAVADNIIRRVAPANTGLRIATIPVRFVVTKDGDVRDVHVIRATDVQRRDIEEALRQWKFKPYVNQGRAIDIETGLMIKM